MNETQFQLAMKDYLTALEVELDQYIDQLSCKYMRKAKQFIQQKLDELEEVTE